MKKILLTLLLLCLTPTIFATSPIVGGDRDKHGCIGSAGYTWSTVMKQCIRDWEYYDISANLPDTGDKKLNTLVHRKITRLIGDFKKDAEKQIVELSLTGKTNYSIDITSVIENSGSIISIRLNTYTFLGGAHGTAENYTWNYDTKKKSLIGLQKIITKKELEIISKNATAALLKAFPDADVSWLTDGLSPKKVSNYKTFSIKTDANGKIVGIVFYLSDYQIGPHAYGMQILDVDYSDLSVSLGKE